MLLLLSSSMCCYIHVCTCTCSIAIKIIFHRYDRGRASLRSPIVSWLWQVLESFSNEERILFLRFVSGRSRLPTRVSEISQRFQISVQRQVCIDLDTCIVCVANIRHELLGCLEFLVFLWLTAQCSYKIFLYQKKLTRVRACMFI